MKIVILIMSMLDVNGNVVSGQVDGMNFNTITECQAYKKRMGYDEVGSSRLTFSCKVVPKVTAK